MSRVTLGGIAAPVHYQIGTILDFPEGAGDFTAQLGGDFGWAVSQRRVAIDDPAQGVRHSHTLTLRLTGRIAHSVNQGQVGLDHELGGSLNSLVQRCFLTVHKGRWKISVASVIQEPSLAQNTSPLRLVNSLAVGVQINVIANATAERTSSVADNL